MDRQNFSPLGPAEPNQDYILRLIEEFGVFVAKLMARIRGGEAAGARKQIEAFYRDTLASDAGLLHTLSDTSLIGLLSRDGELDAVKALHLGKVLKLDADLAAPMGGGEEDREPMARVKSLLAFSLFMEVALQSEGRLPDWAAEDMDALAERIGDWELPPGPRYKLFRYLEIKGRYAKAEDVLFQLRDSGYPGIDAEGRFFYRRLEALGDAELSQGDLPREELEEGKAHFQDTDGG